MVRVGLISDSHGYLDPKLPELIKTCDEVWHAGDVGGGSDFLETILHLKPVVRGVYGNIDGRAVRQTFPEEAVFEVEGLKVMMTHIGGYPGRYAPTVKQRLLEVKPHVFIAGHSHILKVVRDKSLNLLHLNPGAIGFHGFQHVRTFLRFGIEAGKVVQMEAVELAPRYPVEPDF